MLLGFSAVEMWQFQRHFHSLLFVAENKKCPGAVLSATGTFAPATICKKQKVPTTDKTVSGGGVTHWPLNHTLCWQRSNQRRIFHSIEHHFLAEICECASFNDILMVSYCGRKKKRPGTVLSAAKALFSGIILKRKKSAIGKLLTAELVRLHILLRKDRKSTNMSYYVPTWFFGQSNQHSRRRWTKQADYFICKKELFYQFL